MIQPRAADDVASLVGGGRIATGSPANAWWKLGVRTVWSYKWGRQFWRPQAIREVSAIRERGNYGVKLAREDTFTEDDAECERNATRFETWLAKSSATERKAGGGHHCVICPTRGCLRERSQTKVF